MSGSTPLPPGSADEPLTPPRSRGSHVWWWLLVGVGAIALVFLLVAEPWSPVETEPSPTASMSPAPTTPSPTPTPSVSVAPPGANAMFDALTAPGLFVTTADLVADVPAAESGVEPRILTGQLAWGLPVGSTIEPTACTIAATVVATPPLWYDARSWANDALDFQQEVTLLVDPAAARQAFRELVTTVDACPEYRQINPGLDGASWTAQPAIEGQGVYPSIVLQQTHTAEGVAVPGYVGHMLVGNTIVTWTASALSTGDPDAALSTLGDPTSLSAMVQKRAQLAVRALG